MSKFYVGQKVLVTGDSRHPSVSSRLLVGKVAEIKFSTAGYDGLGVGVWNENKSDWHVFNPSDLQPINETPETLTINGVEYIRKPEPVVEHEWKFGDVAVHDELGVGIVTRIDEGEGDRIYLDRPMGNTGVSGWVKLSSLTFIRRADLSV